MYPLVYLQILILLQCLENSGKKKIIHIQYKCRFFSKCFDMQMIESMNEEPRIVRSNCSLILFIFQMRTLKHRVYKKLSQGHKCVVKLGK
jgi:hypothetical protein